MESPQRGAIGVYPDLSIIYRFPNTRPRSLLLDWTAFTHKFLSKVNFRTEHLFLLALASSRSFYLSFLLPLTSLTSAGQRRAGPKHLAWILDKKKQSKHPFLWKSGYCQSMHWLLLFLERHSPETFRDLHLSPLSLPPAVYHRRSIPHIKAH